MTHKGSSDHQNKTPESRIINWMPQKRLLYASKFYQLLISMNEFSCRHQMDTNFFKHVCLNQFFVPTRYMTDPNFGWDRSILDVTIICIQGHMRQIINKLI